MPAMTPSPDALRHAMTETGWFIHRAHDGPFDMFQVLGERGTGTNVVRKSISKSWRIERTEALGWKHGFPTMVAIPTGMIVVIVLRGAEDWVGSLYKRPWHAVTEMQALSFSDFMRAEWQSVVDRTSDFEMIHPELSADNQPLQFDRHPITGLPFRNVFDLRNTRNAAYLGMLNRDCNLVYVQLEAMNADPRAFIDALGAAFDLTGTERGYRPITRNMGGRFRPSVRGRKRPPDIWPESDQAFARAELDLGIEAQFGYVYD